MATDKTIQRYLGVYRAQGCDVLWFPVHPLHILVPSSGRDLAKRVLSITELLLLHKRKLVFHLLSAGAYMFGQVLQVIASSSGGFTRVRQCLVGLVFDSVVDVVGIPEATADILGYHKGSWGHKTVHAVLGAYFMLSYPLTKSKLLRASGNVRHMTKEWCHVPQIWLYSEDDQVADPRVIEEVIDLQRQQGVDLEMFKWDRSSHVKHILHHRDEYEAIILRFLAKVGVEFRPRPCATHIDTATATPTPTTQPPARAAHPKL